MGQADMEKIKGAREEWSGLNRDRTKEITASVFGSLLITVVSRAIVTTTQVLYLYAKIPNTANANNHAYSFPVKIII